jgi:hypothetical protein
VLLLLEACFLTKSLNALALAYGYREILLSLTGYTTHTIQPLRRVVLQAFNCCYIEEMVKWLRANPGLCVTQLKCNSPTAEQLLLEMLSTALFPLVSGCWTEM